MLQTPNSTIDAAMSKLSTFMLQGWVMTDESCRVPECFVPIMRSKDGSIRFCVTHDPLPTSSSAGKPSQSKHELPDVPTSTVTSNSSKLTAPSSDIPTTTPLNEVSDDEELRIRRERREQSSRASQLIGQKLLQRWTLLNDTCPNEKCYATYVTEQEMEQVVKMEQPVDTGLRQNEIAHTANSERKENSISESYSKTISTTHESATSSTKNLPMTRHMSMNLADTLDTNSVIQTLSRKMHELERVADLTTDPSKLTEIFKAIQACAGAIQACIDVEGVYSRNISTTNV
ncbi:hypothetical protein DFQ29_005827 [Apophysomyces sp. BC1021]|nr:hypothetical protein DFQ29_005827 [Apophysomyces sp. BC1021]